MSNNLKMTFGYQGTDFTRNVKITDIAADDLSGIKSKIKAVNASITGGTSDGLPNFFRSDDYDSEHSIGAFTGITAARLESTTVTEIDLDTEGDATNG